MPESHKGHQVKHVRENEQENMIMKMRQLETNLEGLNKNKEFAINRIAEIQNTIKTIEEVSKSDKEIIFHVGGEAFMPAKPVKGGKVVVMVGANVAMEKDVKDAKIILESRRKEAEDAVLKVQKEIESAAKKLEILASGMQQMM